MESNQNGTRLISHFADPLFAQRNNECDIFGAVHKMHDRGMDRCWRDISSIFGSIRKIKFEIKPPSRNEKGVDFPNR